MAGDSIKNNAAIFFDFNDPVLTNMAITIIVLPTGISHSSLVSGHWSVYPNPSHQSITVSSSLMTNEQSQLIIYDLFGREMISKNFRNEKQITFDVSDFMAGIYLLEIKNENTFYRTKLVKQ